MTTWIIRYLWIEASAKHQGRHLIAEDIGHPPARAVCRHSARWLPASRWRSCARSSKLGQAGVAPKYNMQHPSQRLFRRIRGASCVEYAHGPDKRLDRRETIQIPVNVAGLHSGIYRCDPACGGPLLSAPGLLHFDCVPLPPGTPLWAHVAIQSRFARLGFAATSVLGIGQTDEKIEQGKQLDLAIRKFHQISMGFIPVGLREHYPRR